MSPNLKIILEQAKNLDIKTFVFPMNKNFALLEAKNKTVILHETFCIIGKNRFSESAQISKNKILTNYIWENNNIPIPKSIYFNKKSDLLKKCSDLPYPIILKEVSGKKSINIFPNIENQTQLKKILKKTNSNRVFVQEMVYGKEYRLLLLKNKLLGALYVVHTHIIGDGKKSIAQLILEKGLLVNKNTLESALKKLSLSQGDVLAKNFQLFLQKDQRFGGDWQTTDCTNVVNKEIITLASKAVAAVNLELGGVDLICDDITKKPNEQKMFFFEVNSRPSLSIHYKPTVGKSQNVAGEILKYIFNK